LQDVFILATKSLADSEWCDMRNTEGQDDAPSVSYVDDLEQGLRGLRGLTHENNTMTKDVKYVDKLKHGAERSLRVDHD
jgi:hypothetical protein